MYALESEYENKPNVNKRYFYAYTYILRKPIRADCGPLDAVYPWLSRAKLRSKIHVQDTELGSNLLQS